MKLSMKNWEDNTDCSEKQFDRDTFGTPLPQAVNTNLHRFFYLLLFACSFLVLSESDNSEISAFTRCLYIIGIFV